MFKATLRCGTELTYEARDFVPVRGDVVPCRRHGYCVVEEPTSGSCGRSERRAARRAQAELLEWLGNRPVTTVHALRAQRFTLRMIAAAERDGELDVDLRSGRVSLRRRREGWLRPGVPERAS